MQRKFLFLLFLCLQTLVSMADPFTVVIDAGHGGKDAGAVGRNGLLEKDLNLDVSIRLASKIRTQYPEIKVLLTRSSDEFIALQKRADFVNKNNANLFICVHTNSSECKTARGTEVFILGTDKMDQNLDVAMRENAVIKLESDYKTTYQGFDPNSVESYIMFELMQNRYIDQSLHFASMVQKEFTQTLHREDRGVRQAAFWVLLKSACPSVLIELGFISNSDEEIFLKSDQGKREMTDAIFRAFCNYYKPSSKPVKKDSIVAPAPTPSVTSVTTNSPAKVATNTPAVPSLENTEEQPVVSKKEVWKVQIFVSKTILPKNDHNFRGVTNYSYREANGIYKYMAGECATREEAIALRDELKSKFPDCFIVHIEN